MLNNKMPVYKRYQLKFYEITDDQNTTSPPTVENQYEINLMNTVNEYNNGDLNLNMLDKLMETMKQELIKKYKLQEYKETENNRIIKEIYEDEYEKSLDKVARALSDLKIGIRRYGDGEIAECLRNLFNAIRNIRIYKKALIWIAKGIFYDKNQDGRRFYRKFPLISPDVLVSTAIDEVIKEEQRKNDIRRG